MARRAMVDSQEVFTAADNLAAEGKPVTALALLDALGGGSLTTVYKHLAAWEANRPSAAKSTISGEIPDVVQNAFANTWKVAAMEASREVAAAKEKAAEEVKAAQQQFQDAMKAIELLEKESDDDGVKLTALETQISALDDSLLKTSNEAAALNAAGEQMKQQLKSQEVEITRLRNDVDNERSRHEQVIKEKDAAIKEAASWQGQVQSLKEQNNELLSRLGGSKDKR